MLQLRTAQVLEVTQEAQNTYFIRLGVEGGVNFEPGQFLQVCCAGDPLAERAFHPFGILGSNAEQGELWLLVRDRGPGSHWLSQRQSGAEVQFYGPCGNGFDLSAPSIEQAEQVLLVGEAIGVVLLADLSNRLTRLGKSVTLLATAPENQAMPPAVFLRSFNVQYQVRYIFQQPERLAGLLSQTNYKAFDLAFFSLAPRTYADLIKKDILGRTDTIYQNPQILFQKLMPCGIGTCGQCEIDTVSGSRLACTDGPVFNLQEVKWRVR